MFEPGDEVSAVQEGLSWLWIFGKEPLVSFEADNRPEVCLKPFELLFLPSHVGSMPHVAYLSAQLQLDEDRPDTETRFSVLIVGLPVQILSSPVYASE